MRPQNKVILHLEGRYAARWRKFTSDGSDIWTRGTIYCNDGFYRAVGAPPPLAKMAASLGSLTPETAGSQIEQLNGFFAFVIQNDHTVLAAVDRVRSIPLFYGQSKDKMFISDNAEWVRKKCGDTEMDPVAQQEFLRTGYVTGPQTLFHQVRQLRAGEAMLVSQVQNGLKIQIHRYYRFLHTEAKAPDDEKALFEELAAVSETTVRRLIEYADGRQIVVPLSAGYDSRLIVALLRRLGYENVLAFSYGAPENHEATVSKAVAESLNYPWEFVLYSNALWRAWWKTKERIDYQQFASEWVSLPHIQDWSAVWKLKESGKLEKDAVFAPGHSADLPAGSRSHSLPALYEQPKMTTEQIIDNIFLYHYSLFPQNELDLKIKNLLREKILANLEPISEFPDQASAFESWDIAQRQAKFIINSVRVYEFWGYDWYIPFWDRDFMLFWQKISLHLRKNQFLYIPMVNKLYERECERLGNIPVINKKTDGKRSSPIMHLRAFIKNSSLLRPIKHAYFFYNNINSYYRYNLCLYGIFGVGNSISFKPRNINGMFAATYLHEVKERKF